MAAVEGLHRRRARERGLDGARRQRRVQPVARRFVRQRRAHRPELPALAEQRPAHAVSSGPNYGYYKRVGARGLDGRGEGSRSFFAGIDTSLAGLFKTLGARRRRGAAALLQPIDARRARGDARRSRWPIRRPSCRRSLAGLAAARARPATARAASPMPRSSCAQGAAVPGSRSTPRSGWTDGRRAASGHAGADRPGAAFAPPPSWRRRCPDRRFEVRARLANRGGVADRARRRIALETRPRLAGVGARARRRRSALARHSRHRRAVHGHACRRRAAQHAALLLARGACRRAATRLSDRGAVRPSGTRRRRCRASSATRVDGVPVEVRETVRRREAKLPYGDVMRELRSRARAWRVTVTPTTAVVPLAPQSQARRHVSVDVLNNARFGDNAATSR